MNGTQKPGEDEWKDVSSITQNARKTKKGLHLFKCLTGENQAHQVLMSWNENTSAYNYCEVIKQAYKEECKCRALLHPSMA